jgi:tetratricopeptide (TPR) repeat protein
MLKKLLSTFSRKGPGPEPESKPAPAAPPPVPEPPATITVYDAYGRELRMPRGEWRDKVLLPNLAKHRDDAEKLASVLISALNDGFVAELVEPAQRLVEIDPQPERRHLILGILLLKAGRLAEAEATLRQGLQQAPGSGTLLTNLAKVHAQRGERAQAEALLWQALQADPNQENGLQWWLAIQKERGGQDAYLEALRQAASLPGGWRPQIWLARHHLDAKELDMAEALYAEVLAGERYDGDALMMISGDLGNHERADLIPDFLAGVYDPQRHGPKAGLNLIQAYLQLGRLDEGEALLSRLYQLDAPPMKPHLDRFSEAFLQARRRAFTSRPFDPAAVEPVGMSLTAPLWQYGLRSADWLFRPKDEAAPKVGFLTLARIFAAGAQPQEQQEDDLGRLTRTIPLYLAEALHEWTDRSALAFLHVIPGGGPVVFGTEPEGSELLPMAQATGLSHLVTGRLAPEEGGQRCRIALRLWECAEGSLVATEEILATPQELSAAVLDLEQRLLAHLGPLRGQAHDAFYTRPTADMVGPYLAELGQLLVLTFIVNDLTPKDSLWGERSILNWGLNMALQWPRAEVPLFMFLSGLSRAADYGSALLPELKGPGLRLFEDPARRQMAARRLLPLLHKALGMEEAFQEALRGAEGGDPEYRAWLERVQAGPTP